MKDEHHLKVFPMRARVPYALATGVFVAGAIAATLGALGGGHPLLHLVAILCCVGGIVTERKFMSRWKEMRQQNKLDRLYGRTDTDDREDGD